MLLVGYLQHQRLLRMWLEASPSKAGIQRWLLCPATFRGLLDQIGTALMHASRVLGMVVAQRHSFITTCATILTSFEPMYIPKVTEKHPVPIDCGHVSLISRDNASPHLEKHSKIGFNPKSGPGHTSISIMVPPFPLT